MQPFISLDCIIVGRDDEMKTAEQIIDQYSDLVYRLALMKTGKKALADEVYQEVFLKYMKYRDKITDSEHEKAWFIRVTITSSKALFLSSWYKKTTSLEIDFPFQENTLASELYYRVMELPEKYRIVVYLHYYEGYSIKDIASLLHRKETTIKTQLKRGRSQLRLILEGDENYA